MKQQRWPMDYQTVPQEFAYSRMQEQMGLNAVNESMKNDYLAPSDSPYLDRYQLGELNQSWSNQLDVVGMQPHSREYLEHDVHCLRSERKFQMIAGQVIDYTDGIQFSEMP